MQQAQSDALRVNIAGEMIQTGGIASLEVICPDLKGVIEEP